MGRRSPIRSTSIKRKNQSMPTALSRFSVSYSTLAFFTVACKTKSRVTCVGYRTATM